VKVVMLTVSVGDKEVSYLLPNLLDLIEMTRGLIDKPANHRSGDSISLTDRLLTISHLFG
jgi:hypothetical protein